MLDNATLQSLLNPPKRQAKGIGKALIHGEWVTLTKKMDVGHFEGNVGTKRRTRKGATRVNANGRRFYCNIESEVSAYIIY